VRRKIRGALAGLAVTGAAVASSLAVASPRAGGQLRLSVDGGTPVSTTAPAGSVTAGHGGGIAGITIGAKLDGTDRFNGSLDEVRIWKRALSTDELRQVRATNTTVGGAVLHLPMETVRPG